MPLKRSVRWLTMLALAGAALAPTPRAAGAGAPGYCAPIQGIADFHNHQFSNLGFGGKVVWGHSFHPEGPGAALPPCGDERALCLDPDLLPTCLAACAGIDDCEAACHASVCRPGGHGPAGTLDLIGWSLGEKASVLGVVGHDVAGSPSFTGWPAFTSFTHQQVFYQWLHRAFIGGLRLVVVLAVNNEVLCEFGGAAPGFDCNDMHAVDRQLAAAHGLEALVDFENDGQRNNNGWYRIARSASHARQIIADGALAVVLGTEVSTLFDCYADSARGCTPEQLGERLQRYYELGVRHVFPVHVFDNGFGGTGATFDFFNYGNAAVYGQLIEVEDCSSQGYEFAFGGATGTLADGLGLLKTFFGLSQNWSDYPDARAHCNVRGLTPLGAQLIDQLMDRGMIIDLDHMSARLRHAVLERAEQRGYPALTAGHASFTELSAGAPDPNRNGESNTTPAELVRIFSLGGLVAPIQSQGTTEEVASYVRPGALTIPNDCGDSSKTWAQAYLYAVDRMGGRDVAAVGIGSDWNGMAGQPAPRFGADACNGDTRAPQANPVRYPFALHDSIGGTMDRHRFGERTFDINQDGLAQVGLLPDFIADLRAIGLSDRDLDPLFRSAEAYLAMWEKVENAAPELRLPPVLAVDEGARLPLLPLEDPDCDDSWSAVVHHGDGTSGATLALERRLELPHAYADDGSYTLEIILRDAAGASRKASTRVEVRNVAPTVGVPRRMPNIEEGEQATLTGVSFHDAGTLDTHTATVHWGDGGSKQPAAVTESPFGPPGSTEGATGTLAAAHVYTQDGIYQAEVCVEDDDGGRGCAAFRLDVKNAAPVVGALPQLTANEGSEVSLSSAQVAFFDPGVLDSHSAVVSWGDGLTEPAAVSGSGEGTVEAKHVYTQDGIYQAEVCVRDEDAAQGCASFRVTVLNVAPAVTASVSPAIQECAVGSVGLLASVDDPGVLDSHSGTANWGDGAADPLEAGAPRQLEASHSYRRTGTFTIGIQVFDDAGAEGRASAAVRVEDTTPPSFKHAVPAVTITATDPAGTPYEIALPEASDQCGGVRVTSDSPGRFPLGTTTVTFTASDEAGLQATATTTVTVTNRAPIAEPGPIVTDEDRAVAVALAGVDPDGHSLRFTIDVPPAQGILAGSAPDLVYTPAANFHGSDELRYSVSDPFGATATASILIEVRPVNDPPVAVGQSLTTPEGIPVAIVLSGADVDGDALFFQVTSGPAQGALAGAPPQLVYTPNPAWTGTDAFTFVASDGALGSAPAAITISVTPDPDGEMHGDGYLDQAGQRQHFRFRAFDSAGLERGSVRYARRPEPGLDRSRAGEGGADEFVATRIAAISFSDDAGLTPGRPAQPAIESVALRGMGSWNGAPGFAFELRAADAGEPAQGRDWFEIVIKDAAGTIVAQVAGTIQGGNVQSRRLAPGRAAR